MKCPLCGEPLSVYLLNALAQANCNNDACQVACIPMPVAFWRAIHDRLAAVRAEERERCAKICEKEASGWSNVYEANMRDAALECAARIREG